MFLNNETAVMLVYPTSPPGIELHYRANVLWWKNKVTDHVSENTPKIISKFVRTGNRAQACTILLPAWLPIIVQCAVVV